VPTLRTLPRGSQALADWLVREEVTRVVMEATGQYCKPVWYVLEEQGFELLLVNARHVKIPCPAARPTSVVRQAVGLEGRCGRAILGGGGGAGPGAASWTPCWWPPRVTWPAPSADPAPLLAPRWTGW
jgi:hypothetical protein